MENTLKSCPFCGNDDFSEYSMSGVVLKEDLRKTLGWGLPAPEPYKVFYVRCGKCYAKSGAGISGYNGLAKRTITEDEARQLAIEKWNMRA